jgi:hypothetical protein
MNFEIAQQLDEHLKAIVSHANQVLFIANNAGDDALKKKTQLALGSAITSIDLELWEYVYSQHPSLRPPEMLAVGLPE